LGRFAASIKYYSTPMLPQAIAKIPLDVEDLKIDLMSLTAHKVYGP
jgi:hypothetical protein